MDVNQRLNGLNPLAYVGVNAYEPTNYVNFTRDPTPNDLKNFELGSWWENTTNYNLWYLAAQTGGVATWLMVSGGTGSLVTLTGNTGGPVSPLLGNINVVGDAIGITIAGNPGTSTLTASLVGGGVAAQSFPTDSGTATPNASGVLNIRTNQAAVNAGSTVSFTGSTNVVQLNVSDALNNTIIGSLAGNLTLTGNRNTGLGRSVFTALTSSVNSTGVGAVCLSALTSGSRNSAVGDGSLALVVTGSDNTALGFNAGSGVTTGSNNTFIGSGAGSSVTTGGANTIIGYSDPGFTNAAGYVGIAANGTKFIHNFPGASGANIFIGYTSGSTDVGQLTNGANVTLGQQTLSNITTAHDNCAMGYQSGQALTTGSDNVLLGRDAGLQITTGGDNTLVGNAAGNVYTTSDSSNVVLGSNNFGLVGESGVVRLGANTGSTNNSNTFVGFKSGNVTYTLASATANTHIGATCGRSLTTGTLNTSIGVFSLDSATTAIANTAVGTQSLRFLTTGTENVAIGSDSQKVNVSGNYNISVGVNSYENGLGSNNVAIGADSLVNIAGAGNNNVSIGYIAGQSYTTTESNNIIIGSGNIGTVGESNVLRIGRATGSGDYELSKAFVQGIYGITPAGATSYVIIDSAGQLGTGSATGSTVLNYTSVNTTPYVVLTTDDYLGVDSSGGSITIQLPNAPVTGRVFYVKDKTGSAATNNITVTTVGGVVLIDGATTFVMNTAYESGSFIFNGSSFEVF